MVINGCYYNQGQRTVYRLTLVKQWNTEELAGYAELVDIGQPDFIEVKVSIREEERGEGCMKRGGVIVVGLCVWICMILATMIAQE